MYTINRSLRTNFTALNWDYALNVTALKRNHETVKSETAQKRRRNGFNVFLFLTLSVCSCANKKSTQPADATATRQSKV